MKLKLLLVLLFISSLSFAQWQAEGTLQFTNNSLDVDITTDANGVPYVAYSDITDGLVHVKMFNGTSWIDVGANATGVVVPRLLSIAINPSTGYPWVAYRNNTTARVDVIKYDGSSWSTDRATLTSFDPQSKIVLKFSPTGDAVIGTQSGTSVTNSTFYLYKRNTTGSWTSPLNSRIFANCFDLASYNKVVLGFPYQFTNWRPRVHTYEETNGTWTLTTNTGYTPSGGVNAYMFSLAAAKDHTIHHYNEQHSWPQTEINQLYLVSGANPANASSPTKRSTYFEYNNLNFNYYGMYYNSSEQLVVQEYNEYINTWSDLSIGLSFTGIDPEAKLSVSQDGTKVYVAYLDTDKVSVQYYPITAPVAQVYVDIDATGTNDGSTWANAYDNIQDAIDNTSLPTQIWVAEGTYKPTNTTGQSATFLIENTVVEMYGGFDGTETTLNERDVENNTTILSGDLNGDDNTSIVHTEATRSDNSYHVVSLKGKGSGTIIDGFTISDGNANGVLSNSCTLSGSAQDDARRGGAIYTQAYSSGSIKATIKNCVLENNTGSDTSVYATLNPCGHQNISVDVDFESCIVRNNYANTNSAFLIAGSATYNQYSRGSIVNSVFYNNTSSSSASSIYLGGGTGITYDIINSTFANNTGVNGSVIKMVDASNTTLKNSIIYGNGSIIPFDITTNSSTVSNSIIQGGQVSGSTISDPLFTNLANNDFTLQATSPAIDAGSNADLSSEITVDILGNNRISGGTVDLGAYETVIVQQTLATTATNGTITADVQPTNGTYDYGTVVELTATPDAGYQFDGWSGDATGTTNPLSITMDADKSITAMFSLIQQTLTTAATNGTITADIQPTNGTYDYGTIVELTAVPDVGYEFESFSTVNASGGFGLVSTTNPMTITMDDDKTITPTFSRIQRTITLPVYQGVSANNVSPILVTYSGSVATLIYNDGDVTELTATPASGYQFDGWSGDATGTSNPLSVTMDADKTITVIYSIIQQTLTTTAVNGAISLDIQPTNGTYDYGTVVELTATPDTGYQFDGWSGDVSGTANPLSITMDADKNVTALFSLIPTASVVDNEFNSAISVYPNPVLNTLKVDLASGQELKSLQVFNLIGKKVFQTNMNTVDFSTISSGIYLLKVENTKGKIAIRKVIKE